MPHWGNPTLMTSSSAAILGVALDNCNSGAICRVAMSGITMVRLDAYYTIEKGEYLAVKEYESFGSGFCTTNVTGSKVPYIGFTITREWMAVDKVCVFIQPQYENF